MSRARTRKIEPSANAAFVAAVAELAALVAEREA